MAVSPQWKFILARSSDLGQIGELQHATGRSLTLVFNRPGTCNFTLPMSDDMQPYVAMTYIIKAFNGASPTSSTTGNSQKANLPITGDGVASVFTLYHTLQLKANEPFIGQVWEADSSGNPTKQAVGDILYNDFQTVKVSFSRPPANGAKYIVTVIG